MYECELVLEFSQVCLHVYINYSTYDTTGGSSMQLPWVICLVICAFNESRCSSNEHTNTL